MRATVNKSIQTDSVTISTAILNTMSKESQVHRLLTPLEIVLLRKNKQ